LLLSEKKIKMSTETDQKLHELLFQSHQCYDDYYKEQNEELKEKYKQKYQEKETMLFFFMDFIMKNHSPRAVP
jgi:hypothetical protein